MRKLGICALALMIAAPPVVLRAASIWSDKNIYSSGESLRVGDIISVNIDDISQMRFTMNLNDSGNFSIRSNPDATITGFLPKVSSEKKITSTDKTDVNEKGTLKIVIGSRITARQNDGKLQVGGAREYSFNGVTSRFTLTGIIDPASVKGGSVRSRDIANLRLEIRGLKEAPGVNIARPPLKPDETASTNLTEEEKQRIIVEYLNKMLKELSR